MNAYFQNNKTYLYVIVNYILGVIKIMIMLTITKVGNYYKTTILYEIRKLLNISKNNEVKWVFENGRIYLRRKGEQ